MMTVDREAMLAAGLAPITGNPAEAAALFEGRPLTTEDRSALAELAADDASPVVLAESGAMRVFNAEERERLPVDAQGFIHFLDAAGALTNLQREQLIDRVWGSDYVGDTKTLDVHVKRLRAKVEADPANPTRIVTIRGLGYRFERSKA